MAHYGYSWLFGRGTGRKNHASMVDHDLLLHVIISFDRRCPKQSKIWHWSIMLRMLRINGQPNIASDSCRSDNHEHVPKDKLTSLSLLREKRLEPPEKVITYLEE
jgi:hypothetical protein